MKETKSYIKGDIKKPRYCNLYYNNNTRQYKTGEHRYDTKEEAMANVADYPYYIYFDSIECSLKES